MEKKKAEYKKFYGGQGVTVTVWTNEGKNGLWYNSEITRSYKDAAGKYHSSSKFTRDQLLSVAKAAHQAFDYITGLDDAEQD